MSELNMTAVFPLSLSEIAEEQARSSLGLEGEKVIEKDGIFTLIPQSMTSSPAVAVRSEL